MHEVIFATILCTSLFIPGIFFVGVIKKHFSFNIEISFLLSLALSYSCFTILLGVFQILALSVPIFKALYWVLLLSSSFCTYILYKDTFLLKTLSIVRSNIGCVVLLVITTFLHLILGQYDEVPADLYQHLYYFQKANFTYSSPRFELVAIESWVRQAGLIWYHLIAFSVDVSGISTSQLLYVTGLIAKLVFLSGVYFFSKIVFSKSEYVDKLAFVTVFLVAAHMGINVFSFLRYYSFAPTMVNMVLFYSIVSLSLYYFETSLPRIKNIFILFLIGLISICSSAIHTQEAVFGIIIFICLSCVYAIFPAFKHKPKRSTAKIFTPIFLLIFIISYYYIRNTIDAAPNVDWRLWDFGFTHLAFLPKIMVLNLQNQFIQVVTLWGLVVLVFSIVYGKKILENAFLVAGLISPFVTILNPFFIDMFLRLYDSTTVWRLTYLIPIYFLGSFLLVYFSSTFYTNKSVFKTVSASFSIVILIVLLLPLGVSFGGTHFTRFATYEPVSENNSYRHLRDVIEELDNISDKKIVLTDPITGYIISGMTHHYSYRKKFFRQKYYHFTFKTYKNKPLLAHKGKLLLVNKRSYAKSKVGRLGGHWPENILDVSDYYPDSLLNNLRA